MDNNDFSNLPLLGNCADPGEYYIWLTAEQNTRAALSGLSAAVSAPEQVELLQPFLTYEEQLSEQRVLADFDISLLPSTRDQAISEELGDPFAALAAYQPLTFDNNTEQPLDSNLGLLGDINTSALLAEPEGNNVLEQLGQLQGESDAIGIVIAESATSDTFSGEHQGKRRLTSEPSKPRKVIIRDRPESSIRQHFQKTLGESARLSRKKQKIKGKQTELLHLPRGMKTIRQFEATPEKSAISRKDMEPNTDQSLLDRVERETDKLIVRREGVRERLMCGYPNCGFTCTLIHRLKAHIFRHIRISKHKCTYPECGDNKYFRDRRDLKRHVETFHSDNKPYYCELCNKSFGRFDNYRRHMSKPHKKRKCNSMPRRK